MFAMNISYSKILILQNTFSLMCQRTHPKAIRDENVGTESIGYSVTNQFYHGLRLIDLNVFCKTEKAPDQKM